MILGKVIGNVVSTKKEDSLIGMKLLIVEAIDSGKHENILVSVDLVGAGNGDFVLLSNGSSARVALRNQQAPVDSIIIGIVDNYQEIEEKL